MRLPGLPVLQSAAVAALFVPHIVCSQIPLQMPLVPAAAPTGLQALAQAAAWNNQRLRAYRWVETITVTVGGRRLPPRQALCWYAAAGTIARLPIGATQVEPAAGPLPKRKIAEVTAEIEAARELGARYLPIRPEELARALQTRPVQFQRDGVNDEQVVVTGYEKPGDQLQLSLEPVTKRLRHITVSTYLATPAEPMLAAVQFATLGDGTRYPSVTTLEAPSRQLSIRIDNTDFSLAR